MSWFKSDPGMLDHPKVMAIKPEHRDSALALWFRAGLWSTKYLTNGFVPASQVRTLTRSKVGVQELLRVGLWEEKEGGFQFHDWLDYQLAKSEIENKRLQTKQRVSRFRNAVTNALCNASSNAVSNAVSNGVGNASRNATLGSRSRSEENFERSPRSHSLPPNAREKSFGPGENGSQNGSGNQNGLASQVASVLRSHFAFPESGYSDRQVEALASWLELHHGADPIGVCSVVAEAFAKDPWAAQNGFPLGDLANRPERYLGGSSGLLDAKRAAARACLRAEDVDGWRALQVEIAVLERGDHGTR